MSGQKGRPGLVEVAVAPADAHGDVGRYFRERTIALGLRIEALETALRFMSNDASTQIMHAERRADQAARDLMQATLAPCPRCDGKAVFSDDATKHVERTLARQRKAIARKRAKR